MSRKGKKNYKIIIKIILRKKKLRTCWIIETIKMKEILNIIEKKNRRRQKRCRMRQLKQSDIM